MFDAFPSEFIPIEYVKFLGCKLGSLKVAILVNPTAVGLKVVRTYTKCPTLYASKLKVVEGLVNLSVIFTRFV